MSPLPPGDEGLSGFHPLEAQSPVERHAADRANYEEGVLKRFQAVVVVAKREIDPGVKVNDKGQIIPPAGTCMTKKNLSGWPILIPACLISR